MYGEALSEHFDHLICYKIKPMRFTNFKKLCRWSYFILGYYCIVYFIEYFIFFNGCVISPSY